MHRAAGLTFSLMFGLVGARGLFAQDDASLKEALARLDSPFADERATGKSDLIAHKGDLSKLLREAMAQAPECVQAELLEVAQSRKDAALVQEAAAMLAQSSARLKPAAREYLLALDASQLRVDAVKLGKALSAWREFLGFRRRYVICGALLEAQFKPGKYLGQFEALRQEGGAELDAELLRLAAPDEIFCEPLELAAAERFARGLDVGDYVRTAKFRRLANAELLSLALAIVARGNPDEEQQRRAAGVDASTFTASLYAVQDLRIAAVRALALSENREDTADRLAALHVAASKDVHNETLKRALDQESLREEIEVSLAHFGRVELLAARIANLRKRYEEPATGQAAVAARSNGDPELVARAAIAYLFLRAGDAASAESEWLVTVEKAVERMNTAGGRARTALAATLGTIYYNLACAQSRQNKTTKALASLEKAVENGYVDFAWMLEDGDLESLRETRAFSDWFSDVAPPSLVDSLGDRR